MPKELLYGQRMSQWLRRLRPDAPEPLQLAARAQHLRRWEIPRDTFPMDKRGYLMWRKKLYTHHADAAAQILHAAGYDTAAIERVKFLIQKRRLNEDPDTQSLEDAACLVFLEHHLADFAQRVDEEKLIDIIRKTWNKMSPTAHALALQLPFSPPIQQLLTRALAPS